MDRIPRDSQADLSKLKESFEELEKWGESINSQTNNPKLKEVVNREFATKRTKRAEIRQSFETHFKKRIGELSNKKVDGDLLKEIQEFRKFVSEAVASEYLPSEIVMSGNYERLVRLSSSQ